MGSLGKYDKDSLFDEKAIEEFEVDDDFGSAAGRKKGVSAVRRKNNRKTLIAVLAVLVLVAVVAGVLLMLPGSKDAKRYYSELSRKYVSGSMVKLPDSYNEKFGYLYAVNPDVFGWITVTGTDINYPIVKPGDVHDAGYYDTHFFAGEKSEYGTPYFKGISDKNTVISAREGLFGSLAEYSSMDFFISNPVFLMDTVYSEGYYKVLSAFSSLDSGGFDPETAEFQDDTAFSDFVETAMSFCPYDTGNDVNTADNLLTVVCRKDDGTSFYIVARKARKGESLSLNSKDVSKKNIGEKTVLCTAAVSEPDDGTSEGFDPGQTSSTSGSVTTPPISLPDIYIPDIDLSHMDYDDGGFDSGTQFENNGEYTPPDVSTVPIDDENIPVDDDVLGNLTVLNSRTGEKVTDTAVNILAAIVEAEVGGFSNEEVLKAQAVASYSYLLYYKTSSDNPVAVVMKTPSQRVIEAVRKVAGQAVVYGNSLCCTQYFAASAGRTASCKETWGADRPYLVSVDSSVEESLSVYRSSVSFSSQDIKSRAKSKFGITLEGDPSGWFKITSYDSGSRYVTGVSLGGHASYTSSSGKTYTITGRSISETLLSYKLRSHAFEVRYDASSDTFVFTVYGWGHGVGMSQYGANEYANAGYDYIWILKHYFTGASVEYVTEL